MLTIELQQLIFHAHHGIYAEERTVTNSFEVNLAVSLPEGDSAFNTTEDTISYVNLYAIVKQKIRDPTHLLEKICREIIGKIKSQYPQVTGIRISIYKLRAPIENFTGRVGVTLEQTFTD